MLGVVRRAGMDGNDVVKEGFPNMFNLYHVWSWDVTHARLPISLQLIHIYTVCSSKITLNGGYPELFLEAFGVRASNAGYFVEACGPATWSY